MSEKVFSIKELEAAASVITEYLEESANVGCAASASGIGSDSRRFSFPAIQRRFIQLEERAERLSGCVRKELSACRKDPEGLPEGNDFLCGRIQQICVEILENDLDDSSTGYDGNHGRNRPSMKMLTKWSETLTDVAGTYR